jgi:hypothetical protein
MTTLTDINQTLVDQGDTQERTVEAIESLVGRIADLVNFTGRGPDDQLDELENRREKAAEERKDRMAGMKKVVQTVQKNSGLLMKLLAGGALVGILAASSKEFREDIANFVVEVPGKVIDAIFENPELMAGFTAIGETIGKGITGAVDIGLDAIFSTGRFGRERRLEAAPEESKAALSSAILSDSGLDQQTMAQAILGQGAFEGLVPNPDPQTPVELDQNKKFIIDVLKTTGGEEGQALLDTSGALGGLNPFTSQSQQAVRLLESASKAAPGMGAFAMGDLESVQKIAGGGGVRVLAPVDTASSGLQTFEDFLQSQKGKPIGFENAAPIPLVLPDTPLPPLQGVENFLQNQRDKPIGFENAAPIPFLGRFFGQNNVEPVPGSSGMNIMEATENLGGAPGGGATVIQQDNSTNNFFNGGGGGGGSTGGVVPIPSDINVGRLDILGNFGTGRLM